MVGVLGSPKGMRHILPAETRATVRMPVLATVPFLNPPEQQCYLNNNHTLPPGWCIPVSSLPVRHKRKDHGNGKQNHICRSGRRNRGAPCQALQSSPCRLSGILRRQNAAEKRAHKPHPQLREKRRAPASRMPRHRRKVGSARLSRRASGHSHCGMPRLSAFPRVTPIPPTSISQFPTHKLHAFGAVERRSDHPSKHKTRRHFDIVRTPDGATTRQKDQSPHNRKRKP